MVDQETIDISPSPRILRVLGEIPFSFWQCIAELIDNSIDAFLKKPDQQEQTIEITWSSSGTPFKDKTIEITDNASGMSKEQIQNAVRAGYSSNNPMDNLGLFGVGFNISTARLGYCTEIISTRSGDNEWVGILIDFAEINKKGRFDAPVVHYPKNNVEEHGTKIIISKLRNDFKSSQDRDLRKQLSNVYSALLRESKIEIIVKGQKLAPKKTCVWSDERYAVYKKEKVSAVQYIDRNLGDTYFDIDLNRYLNEDECYECRKLEESGKELPQGITKRGKHLHGWVGIQRFADVDDFGLDFIRNGRKILLSDKSLFYYYDDLSGKRILQYPVELGSTVGGRIVGEIHVDYLIPTYQKNDFERDDESWRETVYALCGDGILLPKTRLSHGLPENNDSPIGKLANAYRRTDPGTKCLYLEKSTSRQFYDCFVNNDPDYQDDELWFKAAQEYDQNASSGGQTSTPVNPGEITTTSPTDFIKPVPTIPGVSPVQPPATPVEEPPVIQTSDENDLMQRSTKIESLSNQYGYSTSPFNVQCYEVNQGNILFEGTSVPCKFITDGIDCKFFYDPHHDSLLKYPIDPKYLLLIYLAEKFKARDGRPDIVYIYSELMKKMMPDRAVDKQVVSERISDFFTALRSRIYVSLSGIKQDVVNCIHESEGEVEETCKRLMGQTDLLNDFMKKTEGGYGAIEYVPQSTLIRLVDSFPEKLFDGVVFKSLYTSFDGYPTNMRERLRSVSKTRIVTYLKEIDGMSNNLNKMELYHLSLGLDMLYGELI